jgi:glycosyltransferase involved in cell wall biosynthesis
VYPFTEIIIVDWSSKEEDIVSYIKSINDARLKVVRISGQQYFNQGASWNVGIRYASSEWLCGIDCDDILKHDAFSHILPLDEKKFYTGLPATCTHGMVLFSKNAWIKTQGFVEIFNTWSQDDVLFYRDLQQAGFERQLSFDSKYVEHINHDDTVRFKNHEMKMSMNDAIAFNIQRELNNKNKLKGMKKYEVQVYKWQAEQFVTENICI